MKKYFTFMAMLALTILSLGCTIRRTAQNCFSNARLVKLYIVPDASVTGSSVCTNFVNMPAFFCEPLERNWWSSNEATQMSEEYYGRVSMHWKDCMGFNPTEFRWQPNSVFADGGGCFIETGHGNYLSATTVDCLFFTPCGLCDPQETNLNVRHVLHESYIIPQLKNIPISPTPSYDIWIPLTTAQPPYLPDNCPNS